MAILETIRRKPGLMVGFIGVALAAFVIGDGLQNGSTWFSANQRVALSVDGEEVDIDEYERKYQLLSEQMQQQMGGQQLTDEQRVNLNNGLAQQIIGDRILKKLANQVGLRVTTDEVFALLHTGQGVSPSPLAQQFFASLGVDINDSKAVNEFIAQISEERIKALPAEQQTVYRRIQAQWQNLQDQIVTNRLQQKLGSLLSRSYKVTKLDQDLAVAGGPRSVALVRTTPLAGMDKNDTPTEEEIKKYYEAHKSLFLMQSPSADISYISAQVLPSSEDYKAAEAKASKAYADLQTSGNVAAVVRNLGGTLNEAYLTGAELNQLGLGDAEVEFVKSASVGDVHNSGLVSDRYSLIKLVAKKTAPESLGVQLIALDSVSSKKADSLLTAIKSGANFEEMVTKYSQDVQTKENGGRLSQQGQYGMLSDSFTEAQLAGSILAEVFTKPVGEAYIANSGNAKVIIRSVDAKPAVEKYQLAVVYVDATFSDKTYTAKYDAINRILGAGGSFEDMSKKAEQEGFMVVKSESINTSSPQLGSLPSSRPVIQWALNADDDTLTDKVYRLGTDYLVIAKVNKHYEAGIAPLSLVKENITAALSAEKRAKNLAEALAKKGLNSLEAYANELNVQVDSISGVNYFVRGSEPALFNGKAMTTAVGQLSKPFAAGTEVMVLQPVSTEAPDKEAISAQARQAEQGVGYQLVSRAFQSLLQKSKVEDNRARFY